MRDAFGLEPATLDPIPLGCEYSASDEPWVRTLSCDAHEYTVNFGTEVSCERDGVEYAPPFGDPPSRVQACLGQGWLPYFDAAAGHLLLGAE